MLQRIRDNASGPIAYAVVALIALVFGVWGIGSYFTPSADPVVASVGGTDITRNQLQQAYNQRYARLRQMMGKNFDPSLVPPDQLRHTVLQGMIDDAVLDQYANQAGYRVTDANLLAELSSNPQFQANGQFSAKRYRALLAQAGISAARYEASLRKGIKSQEVRKEITASAFATPTEIQQAYRLVHQQRQVRYLAFDPSNYHKQIQVGQAQVKAYYKNHPKQFMRPQRVKLSFVTLDRASASGAPPSQKTLRALYKNNKAKLGTPEKRAAEQIKVPIKNNNDASARNAIESVVAAVNQGKPLKAAAQATTGAQYRHIKASPRASLPDALGKVLFALNKGQTSSPVKGAQAWYLVKLDHVVAAQTPPFDDPQVQSQLRAIASAEQARKAYKKKSSTMDDLAYQAPNDLHTLANKLDLKIQHSGWISQNGGPGIGQYAAIRKAAFSDSVLKDKLNSTVISLGDNRKVVLRVDKVAPAKRKPLSAVHAKIHSRLVAQKAQSKAKDAAQHALKELNSGQTMAALAKQNPAVSLKSPGYINRSASNIDPSIVDTVFSLPTPTRQKPSYAVTSTAQGAIALVGVVGVQAGNDSTNQNAQTQRKQFAQRQRSYVGGLEYAALNDYLKSQASVSVNQSQL